MIVSCNLDLDMILPLLDMWAVDMWCVELSATWIKVTRATSRISHLLFRVSHYLVSCYQQSSRPVIVLHVPCTILVPDILCNLNIIDTTWGWGRLDGWLGLVGWMSRSIVSPTVGDTVVLATFSFLIFHYLFHPSGLAMVSAARETW